MSRVGKQSIVVPSGVDVAVVGGEIVVKGIKGQLKQKLVPEISVEINTEKKKIQVNRNADTKRHRGMHGLYQRLIVNMITGVMKGFETRLKVQGMGYRAELKGKDLVLSVGFANTITVRCPEGVVIEVPKAASREEIDVFVRGFDKQLVGEIAAKIRKVRPCDPYQAKGIRYSDEVVRRLEGKSFGAA